MLSLRLLHELPFLYHGAMKSLKSGEYEYMECLGLLKLLSVYFQMWQHCAASFALLCRGFLKQQSQMSLHPMYEDKSVFVQNYTWCMYFSLTIAYKYFSAGFSELCPVHMGIRSWKHVQN